MPRVAEGESRKEKALAALTMAREPLYTSQVASFMGVDPRSASQALNLLLADGKVQRSKSGGPKAREGTKERRWRLRPG
jgi:Mn-dependent DtxR family transcriptional regulator